MSGDKQKIALLYDRFTTAAPLEVSPTENARLTRVRIPTENAKGDWSISQRI